MFKSLFSKQQTYETKVVNDMLFIKCSFEISLTKNLNTKEESNISSDTISIRKENISEHPDENSMNYWANTILCTPNPNEKATLTNSSAEKWFKNELKVIYNYSPPPDHPKRSDSLTIIDPGKIRRGKGGTLVIESLEEFAFLFYLKH